MTKASWLNRAVLQRLYLSCIDVLPSSSVHFYYVWDSILSLNGHYVNDFLATCPAPLQEHVTAAAVSPLLRYRGNKAMLVDCQTFPFTFYISEYNQYRALLFSFFAPPPLSREKSRLRISEFLVSPLWFEVDLCSLDPRLSCKAASLTMPVVFVGVFCERFSQEGCRYTRNWLDHLFPENNIFHCTT